MTARELPRADWHRLADTPIAAVCATLPADTRMIVVEDRDGVIVGTWAMIRYVHAEGVWIAPAHQKRGSVAGRLLRAMRDVAHSWGAPVVLTAAVDDEVRSLIAKLGGARLPDTYVFPARRLCRS